MWAAEDCSHDSPGLLRAICSPSDLSLGSRCSSCSDFPLRWPILVERLQAILFGLASLCSTTTLSSFRYFYDARFFPFPRQHEQHHLLLRPWFPSFWQGDQGHHTRTCYTQHLRTAAAVAQSIVSPVVV